MTRTTLCGSALIVAGMVFVSGEVPLQQQVPVPPAIQAPASGRSGPPVQGAEGDIPLVARFDRNGDKVLDHQGRPASTSALTRSCVGRSAVGRSRRLAHPA